MENEIWKDIPGYEGRYKISNYGKVWSNFKKDFMSMKENLESEIKKLRAKMDKTSKREM